MPSIRIKSKTALVVYYNNLNSLSCNALIGAIETEESLNGVNIYFLDKADALVNKIEKIVKSHEQVVLGISFCTGQVWHIYGLMKTLRNKYGRKLLYIAGGPHPTGDPRGTLNIGFDIVVVGEGEETIIELLKKIDDNEGHGNIKGIAFYNENNEYKYSGVRARVDLDKYPPFAIKHKKFGPIEITRGCPFACGFCQTSHIFGGKPRHRSIAKICEYVEILRSNHLNSLDFITPNAFSYGSADGKKVNIAKIEQLFKSVRAILKKDGKMFVGNWNSELRPEHVSKDTIELIRKYADNDNVVIGAQSGSQRMLDLCHRGHTVQDVYNAVKIVLAAGLKADVDFIFCLPGEKTEDIKKTIVMMKKLAKLGVKVNSHVFQPLPQTKFEKADAKSLNNKTVAMINNLSGMGLLNGNLKEQEMESHGIQLFRGFKGVLGVPGQVIFSNKNSY